MKQFEILLALICIYAGLMNFNVYDPNRCIVSFLLWMTAFRTLSPYPKINRYVRYLSVFLAVFLIMKILVTG